MPLTTCPACQRHLKACATVCPFCSAALPACEGRPSLGRRLLAGGVVASMSLISGCPSYGTPYLAPPPSPSPSTVPAVADAACAVGTPVPLPSPADVAGFTYEIKSAEGTAYVVDGKTTSYVDGKLKVGLLSERQLATLGERYKFTVDHQATLAGPSGQVTCPSYTLSMVALNSQDLTDLPTWGAKLGLQGHYVFTSRSAAALFKLRAQILVENSTFVTACDLVPTDAP